MTRSRHAYSYRPTTWDGSCEDLFGICTDAQRAVADGHIVVEAAASPMVIAGMHKVLFARYHCGYLRRYGKCIDPLCPDQLIANMPAIDYKADRFLTQNIETRTDGPIYVRARSLK